MHGLAGSAALVLLTLDSVATVAAGLGYIALFGVGSTIGMGLLSCAIALPLRAGARAVTGTYRALNLTLGSATICLGLATLYDAASVSGLL